ncbi:MAG: hypothetical protein GF335_04360 [Candidatus Moranbacteria bacterium]|nr:hypothetical protein [Candidatus Moranbacteria bacterium]
MFNLIKNKSLFPSLIFVIFIIALGFFGFEKTGFLNQARAGSIVIQNPLTTGDFEGLVINIIERLRTFVAAIAILMFIISGIYYIFSQGNDEKVQTAKKIMIGTVIGLVIILGAETILKEVYKIFEKTAAPEVSAAKAAYQIVEKFLGLLLSLIGLIGIINLIRGAIMYLTSAGNEDRAQNAKKQIIYSIVGLVIAVGGLIIIRQIDSLLK